MQRIGTTRKSKGVNATGTEVDMKVGQAIVLLGIVMGSPMTAGATMLVAPFIFANDNTYITCQVTNGGTTPANVAITGRGMDGSVVAPTDDLCVGDLGPGGTCFSYFPPNVQVSCVFEVKGRVRAAGALFDKLTNRPVAIAPATAK